VGSLPGADTRIEAIKQGITSSELLEEGIKKGIRGGSVGEERKGENVETGTVADFSPDYRIVVAGSFDVLIHGDTWPRR